MSIDILGKINLKPEIKSFADSIMQEREKRTDISLYPFGVSYLDEGLNGIRKDDFILIGARTGAGKTSLASSIAMTNAKLGKRVFFFALEAADYEIERRVKYQILTEFIYKSGLAPHLGFKMNYMDWIDGKLNTPELQKIEEVIESQIYAEGLFKTLNVIYRGLNEYTVEAFEKQMTEAQDLADLFIVDHLHFFDFDEQNENRAYKRIMKSIYSRAQKLNIPVVMIAHLRKQDKASGLIVPDVEDFHGTSDIVKIPTKIITMSRAKDAGSTDRNVYPTYMRIAKCRGDGSRTLDVATVGYSGIKNCFETRYQLGRLNYEESQWTEHDPQDLPYWAKSAKKRSTETINTYGGDE